MNESEAINVMEKYTDDILSPVVVEAHKMAISALEEVHEYRKIGTVEELQKLKKAEYDIKEMYEDALEEIQQYRAIGTVEELNELKEIKLDANTFPNLYKLQKTVKDYSKIGTVEECWAAMEKKRAKKPILSALYHCPHCERTMRQGVLSSKENYCEYCGGKLDWSEEE